MAFLIDINKSLLPLCPLHRIENGQTAQTFALLIERTLSQTREGKPYYQCRFKDRLRTVTLMVWLDSPWFAECEKTWKPGTAYRLLATYGVHDKYGQQIDLLQIKDVCPQDRDEGYNPADLVESSRFAAEAMWQQLMEFIDNEIEREPVKRLIRTIFERFAERLRDLPASNGKFYPFRGGWLEHVHSLAISCLLLVEHYQRRYADVEPKLDRDLVLSGALLHDIGRVLEFKADELGLIREVTVPGKLFGYLILGRDLVRQTAQEQQDIPPDFLERLEHVILSHLTLPEWGSPRLPVIPEVLILHHADDLDAKLEMYLRCLSRDQNAGPFTARDPFLQKSLLKPGSWPEERVP